MLAGGLVNVEIVFEKPCGGMDDTIEQFQTWRVHQDFRGFRPFRLRIASMSARTRIASQGDACALFAFRLAIDATCTCLNIADAAENEDHGGKHVLFCPIYHISLFDIALFWHTPKACTSLTLQNYDKFST